MTEMISCEKKSDDKLEEEKGERKEREKDEEMNERCGKKLNYNNDSTRRRRDVSSSTRRSERSYAEEKLRVESGKGRERKDEKSKCEQEEEKEERERERKRGERERERERERGKGEEEDVKQVSEKNKKLEEGKNFWYSSDEERHKDKRYDKRVGNKERKEKDQSRNVHNHNDRYNNYNSETDNETGKYRRVDSNNDSGRQENANKPTFPQKEKFEKHDRRHASSSSSSSSSSTSSCSISSTSRSRSRNYYKSKHVLRSNNQNSAAPASRPYSSNAVPYGASSSSYRRGIDREGRYKQYNGYGHTKSSYSSSSHRSSRYGTRNYRRRSRSRSHSHSRSRNRSKSRSRVAYGRLNNYDERDYNRKSSRDKYDKVSGFSSRSAASASPTNFSFYPPPISSSGVSDGVSTQQNTIIQTQGGERIQIESRSVYVGNVDYSSTPQDLQEHFKSCGLINRITIMVDKFTGHPKGFAYIEFGSEDAVQNAVLLTDTFFKGRQIKVNPKRKNVPGYLRTRTVPNGGVVVDGTVNNGLIDGLNSLMFASSSSFQPPTASAVMPLTNSSLLSAPYGMMGRGIGRLDGDEDILGENTVMDKPF